MATIKELAREASYKAYENKPLKYENGMYQVGLSDGIEQGFELGAKAMLDKIENYLNNYDLGNSVEEKFYKLDVIADFCILIKELKGE